MAALAPCEKDDPFLTHRFVLVRSEADTTVQYHGWVAQKSTDHADRYIVHVDVYGTLETSCFPASHMTLMSASEAAKFRQDHNGLYNSERSRAPNVPHSSELLLGR